MNPVLPDLTCLHATISNGALKGDRLPARIKIFNWGDNPSTKGTFHVGMQTLAVLADNQRRHGYERVALDYNHCSVPSSPEHDTLLKSGQPPIIFGYGRPVVFPNDGVYLDGMEWTPQGLQHARNFEDLSPAAANTSGEVDFIHSVALTTNGCLEGVTFFSANGDGLRGRARLESAFEAQLSGAGGRGQTAADLVALLSAEGKAPMNPDTRQPFTGAELLALPIATLQTLRANCPVSVDRLSAARKASPLRGRERLEAAIEQENAGGAPFVVKLAAEPPANGGDLADQIAQKVALAMMTPEQKQSMWYAKRREITAAADAQWLAENAKSPQPVTPARMATYEKAIEDACRAAGVPEW